MSSGNHQNSLSDSRLPEIAVFSAGKTGRLHGAISAEADAQRPEKSAQPRLEELHHYAEDRWKLVKVSPSKTCEVALVVGEVNLGQRRKRWLLLPYSDTTILSWSDESVDVLHRRKLSRDLP